MIGEQAADPAARMVGESYKDHSARVYGMCRALLVDVERLRKIEQRAQHATRYTSPGDEAGERGVRAAALVILGARSPAPGGPA